MTFRPRLNHVAISVDRDVVEGTGRAELIDFFGDVFGWTEGDNSGERGNPLILYTGEFGQFVYLLPADEEVQAPFGDHFGLQVETLEELHAIAERARARAATDDRVRVSPIEARTTHGPTATYTLTSVYIGFRLPLAIELQHLARN